MRRVITNFTLTALAILLAGGVGLRAQERGEVTFDSDLPRVLVFIQEEGGQIAATELTNFMLQAGFPVVDPALAFEAAQRELVRQALAGDEGAATNLGRDFGAQILILGQADWGASEDPFGGGYVSTGEISVRALRLDLGRVVAIQQADGGRQLEITEQRGKSIVLRRAARALLEESPFIGRLINAWEAQPWQEAMYWVPDPGSVPAQAEKAQAQAQAQEQAAPALAILLADVQPSLQGQTRGLGVVKKGDRSSSLFNPVRLEGVVIGENSGVEVDGKPAQVEPLDAEEAARLGLTGQRAQRFWSETTLPMSQDSVRIVARTAQGGSTEAVAAPRIDKRFAVVIGVGQYESEDIPDLEFARADAEAVREFLESDAAGPFDEVLFLADEDATGAAMREAMFVFLQQADWDDLVFIYYAGHGAPDPGRPDNLYLLPTDSDLDAMASTAFPMWDVKTALRRQISAERVIVVADACHSAGTADGDVVGGTGSNHIAGSFEKLFTPSRRLMMTAADTNEFSLEDVRWGGHGVFTHYFLDALQGNGDLDGNGIITFSEVFDHVSSNVVEATDGRQNPQRSGFGDVPLAVVPDASATGQGSGR